MSRVTAACVLYVAFPGPRVRRTGSYYAQAVMHMPQMRRSQLQLSSTSLSQQTMPLRRARHPPRQSRGRKGAVAGDLKQGVVSMQHVAGVLWYYSCGGYTARWIRLP